MFGQRCISLEQSQIITSMLLAALLVFAIEKRLPSVALSSGSVSLIAWFGVLHV
jgi:adenine/guanine/hypoxanthine permease